MNYQEWLALYFDALGVDRNGFDKFVAEHPERGDILVAFNEDIPGYPMLSRIDYLLHDAIYEGDEVEQLRQECLSAKEITSNILALRGLDKLIYICDWAQSLKLNIFLMCD